MSCLFKILLFSASFCFVNSTPTDLLNNILDNLDIRDINRKEKNAGKDIQISISDANKDPEDTIRHLHKLHRHQHHKHEKHHHHHNNQHHHEETGNIHFVIEKNKDMENINQGPKVFKRYLKTLEDLLHKDKEAFEQHKEVQVENFFENKGKLFRVEGNGDITMISNNTKISLNLCHAQNDNKWNLLDGVYFLKCTYTRSPPKRAAYKIKPKEKDWIYPLLPHVTTFHYDQEGTFLFPDIESVDEMDKGSFGLKLTRNRTFARKKKPSDLNRLFRSLLNIIYNDALSNESLQRRKRQISVEENQNNTFSTLIHSIYDGIPQKENSEFSKSVEELRKAAAEAAKATEKIADVDPKADFWTQLLNKTVTILHFIHGVNAEEAKTALNATFSLAKYFVDELATIKSCADETEKFLKDSMDNMALKFINETYGEDEARAAVEEVDLKTNTTSNIRNIIKDLQFNLEKTRKNMDGFYRSDAQ